MELEYIRLAPGYAKEVVEVYESWDGKKSVPMRVQELMMVLRIEVSRLYKESTGPSEPELPKVPIYKDIKLI